MEPSAALPPPVLPPKTRRVGRRRRSSSARGVDKSTPQQPTPAPVNPPVVSSIIPVEPQDEGLSPVSKLPATVGLFAQVGVAFVLVGVAIFGVLATARSIGSHAFALGQAEGLDTAVRYPEGLYQTAFSTHTSIGAVDYAGVRFTGSFSQAAQNNSANALSAILRSMNVANASLMIYNPRATSFLACGPGFLGASQRIECSFEAGGNATPNHVAAAQVAQLLRDRADIEAPCSAALRTRFSGHVVTFTTDRVAAVMGTHCTAQGTVGIVLLPVPSINATFSPPAEGRIRSGAIIGASGHVILSRGDADLHCPDSAVPSLCGLRQNTVFREVCKKLQNGRQATPGVFFVRDNNNRIVGDTVQLPTSMPIEMRDMLLVVEVPRLQPEADVENSVSNSLNVIAAVAALVAFLSAIVGYVTGKLLPSRSPTTEPTAATSPSSPLGGSDPLSKSGNGGTASITAQNLQRTSDEHVHSANGAADDGARIEAWRADTAAAQPPRNPLETPPAANATERAVPGITPQQLAEPEENSLLNTTAQPLTSHPDTQNPNDDELVRMKLNELSLLLSHLPAAFTLLLRPPHDVNDQRFPTANAGGSPSMAIGGDGIVSVLEPSRSMYRVGDSFYVESRSGHSTGSTSSPTTTARKDATTVAEGTVDALPVAMAALQRVAQLPAAFSRVATIIAVRAGPVDNPARDGRDFVFLDTMLGYYGHRYSAVPFVFSPMLTCFAINAVTDCASHADDALNFSRHLQDRFPSATIGVATGEVLVGAAPSGLAILGRTVSDAETLSLLARHFNCPILTMAPTASRLNQCPHQCIARAIVPLRSRQVVFEVLTELPLAKTASAQQLVPPDTAMLWSSNVTHSQGGDDDSTAMRVIIDAAETESHEEDGMADRGLPAPLSSNQRASRGNHRRGSRTSRPVELIPEGFEANSQSALPDNARDEAVPLPVVRYHDESQLCTLESLTECVNASYTFIAAGDLTSARSCIGLTVRGYHRHNQKLRRTFAVAATTDALSPTSSSPSSFPALDVLQRAVLRLDSLREEIARGGAGAVVEPLGDFFHTAIGQRRH